MSAAPHVLFAGGGSGGQLDPGLAVAAQFARKMPEARISFAGPGRPIERHAVRSAGYEYLTIPSRPTPHNPLQAVRFLTDNVAGYCAARWMLREQGISLVVGLGGYTSTAVVRAAVARGTPIILLEQNAVPGRTTRWLSRSSALVCAAFEQMRPHLHVQAPVIVTGNPVRPLVEHLYHRLQRTGRHFGALSAADENNEKKRLIVLGGVEGARSLNESIPSALNQLGSLIDDWQVIHQTGEGQLQETEFRYRQLGVEALAVTSIEEIASVLFASDLVVCRAGGTMLAELALAGVPALLVPSPQVVDDHQIANAKVFASAGAGRLIDETSQTGALDTALACELKSLLCDNQLRSEMGQKMHSLARPEASAEIASAIRDTLCGKRTELMAA